MRSPTILLLASILPIINAQQQPDGLIVPFTSVLPVCASLCGKLFDVQGACVPPNVAKASKSCFCGDPRLASFISQGAAGVSSVCTAVSCTAQADLEKIQSWYAGFCNAQAADPTKTGGGAAPSGTGSSGAGSSSSPGTTTPNSSADQTWFQSHWKWVVMIIVVLLAMIIIWVGAVFLRRRIIRKREREIEMKPPVAWGPHQMQNQSNGYSFGDGAPPDSGGGRSKEAKMMGALATPADNRGTNRESRGWLRKSRA